MILGSRRVLLIILFAFIASTAIYCKDIYHSTSDLNVRSEPSINSEILFVIKKGTEVESLKKIGNWHRISYNGREGFASGKYLRAGNSKSNSDSPNYLFWIILIVVLWFVWKEIRKTQCPECKSYFVRKFLGRKWKYDYEAKRVINVTSTHYDRNRQKTGTTETPVTEYYTVDVYDYSYKCKKCEYKWIIRKHI